MIFLLVGFFYLLLFFIVAVVVVGSGLLFGRTILAPILNATKDTAASLRFYTVDFFTLTVMLALPAVLISRIRDSEMPAGPTILICAIPFALAFFAWVLGASKLSTAKVNGARKRFVFLGVLMPVAFIGAILVPLFIISVLYPLVGSSSSSESFPLVGLVGLFAASLVAYAGRQACKWVIGPDRNMEDGPVL